MNPTSIPKGISWVMRLSKFHVILSTASIFSFEEIDFYFAQNAILR